jgi:hypothetical protein
MICPLVSVPRAVVDCHPVADPVALATPDPLCQRPSLAMTRTK